MKRSQFYYYVVGVFSNYEDTVEQFGEEEANAIIVDLLQMKMNELELEDDEE